MKVSKMKTKGLFYLVQAVVLQCYVLNGALGDDSSGKCLKVEWPNIQNGRLETNNYTVMLHGSPSIVDGPSFKALHLLGSNNQQFINITTANVSCLRSLDTCLSGITLSTWLKCTSIENNMYFISSGSDDSGTSGLTLLYKYGHFVASAKTKTKAWYVIFKDIQPDQWYYIEISWSSNTGLAVYINSRLVAAQSSYEQWNAKTEESSHFLIGRSKVMDGEKKYAKVMLGPLVFGFMTRQDTRSLCLKPNEWATEKPEETTVCSGADCGTTEPVRLSTLDIAVIGLSAVIGLLLLSLLLTICILRPKGKKDKHRMSEKADVVNKSSKSGDVKKKNEPLIVPEKRPQVSTLTWESDKKSEAKPGSSGLLPNSDSLTKDGKPSPPDSGIDSSTLNSQTSTETPPHLRGNQGCEMSDSGFLDTVSTLPIIKDYSKSDSTASRISSRSTTGIDAESLETLAKLDAVVHSEMDKMKKSVSFDDNVEVVDQVNTL